MRLQRFLGDIFLAPSFAHQSRSTLNSVLQLLALVRFDDLDFAVAGNNPTTLGLGLFTQRLAPPRHKPFGLTGSDLLGFGFAEVDPATGRCLLLVHALLFLQLCKCRFFLVLVGQRPIKRLRKAVTQAGGSVYARQPRQIEKPLHFGSGFFHSLVAALT